MDLNNRGISRRSRQREAEKGYLTMTVALAEKRRAPRFTADYPVHFDGGLGSVVNLSSGGICFQTSSEGRFAPGTVRRLYMMLNEGKRETVLLHITVTRVASNGERHSIAGKIERLAIVTEIPGEIHPMYGAGRTFAPLMHGD
jgi:hypothetical protein